MLKTSRSIAADGIGATAAPEQALAKTIASDAPWLSQQQVRELVARHMVLQARITALGVLRDSVVLVGALGVAVGLGLQLY